MKDVPGWFYDNHPNANGVKNHRRRGIQGNHWAVAGTLANGPID